MRTVLLAASVFLLAACGATTPKCGSPEVLALVERLQMEGWNDAMKALRAEEVAKAFAPYQMALMFATMRDSETVDQYNLRKQHFTDSVTKSLENAYDARQPKRSLAYSNTITDKGADAVASCKVQVDLVVNGAKVKEQMATFTARWTDDKKLYVEVTKLNLQM